MFCGWQKTRYRFYCWLIFCQEQASILPSAFLRWFEPATVGSSSTHACARTTKNVPSGTFLFLAVYQYSTANAIQQNTGIIRELCAFRRPRFHPPRPIPGTFTKFPTKITGNFYIRNRDFTPAYQGTSPPHPCQGILL